MNKYIIKKVSIKKAHVNYQTSAGYEFTPKNKQYAEIKKITVLDSDLKEQIFCQKLAKEYKKIVSYIYNLLNANNDDGTSTLVAYTELKRLKQLLAYKYEQKVNQKVLEKYEKKLSILEIEVKKLAVQLYQNRTPEINESKGARR